MGRGEMEMRTAEYRAPGAVGMVRVVALADTGHHAKYGAAAAVFPAAAAVAVYGAAGAVLSARFSVHADFGDAIEPAHCGELIE